VAYVLFSRYGAPEAGLSRLLIIPLALDAMFFYDSHVDRWRHYGILRKTTREE
jgi:hypothetical protein